MEHQHLPTVKKIVSLTPVACIAIAFSKSFYLNAEGSPLQHQFRRATGNHLPSQTLAPAPPLCQTTPPNTPMRRPKPAPSLKPARPKSATWHVSLKSLA